MPTLVIGATHDTMDPVHMKWVARQVQHGSFLLCPNGSHLSMWDDQRTYVPGLVRFLRAVDVGQCRSPSRGPVMTGENRTIARRWVVLLALAGMASVAHAQPAARPVSVRFELNDAQVKGRALEGVAVTRVAGGRRGSGRLGPTGGDGRWTAQLAPGRVPGELPPGGLRPYTSEATEIREDGQLVTVSLSRLLEATESGGRDVRIILNWGSRPGPGPRRRLAPRLPLRRGGPATSTTRTARTRPRTTRSSWTWTTPTGAGRRRSRSPAPRPGTYLYWVHDYSGPPATLGASDVVVRVVIGAEEAGEFRVFKGVTRRAWRPFKAIEVSREGVPTLVRFTEDEIAEAADLVVPAELQPPDAAPEAPSPPSAEPATPSTFPIPIFYLLVFFALVLIARARRRRRG